MKVLYADTSAVVGAYFVDEPGNAVLRRMLLTGEYRVITSELTRIEYASAVTAAKRTGRILDAVDYLRRFDADTGRADGLGVIPFEPRVVMPAARRIVCDNYPLRTLDALHLAVAMHDTAAVTGGAPVTFVTTDQRQADAARGHGFEVC